MPTQTIEKDLSAHASTADNETPWWKPFVGMYRDEPLFDSVMRTIEENRERDRAEVNRLTAEEDTKRELSSKA